MSDATRAVAISEAVKLAGLNSSNSVQEVLSTAKAFDDFLNATGETADAKVSTPGKEPAKPAVGNKAGGSKKGLPKGEEALAAKLLAQQAAADAAADVEADAADAAGGEAELDVEIKFDKDGVQATVAKMLEANKRKEAITLLKKFGAASAGGVKAKDFKTFITEGLKVVAEAGEEGDDLTA